MISDKILYSIKINKKFSNIFVLQLFISYYLNDKANIISWVWVWDVKSPLIILFIQKSVAVLKAPNMFVSLIFFTFYVNAFIFVSIQMIETPCLYFGLSIIFHYFLWVDLWSYLFDISKAKFCWSSIFDLHTTLLVLNSPK